MMVLTLLAGIMTILLLAIVATLFGWRKLRSLHDHLLRLQTYLDNHAQQHNRVMDEVKTQTHLLRDTFTRQFSDNRSAIQDTQHGMHKLILQQLADMRTQLQSCFGEHQTSLLKTLHSSLQQGMKDVREQLHLRLREQSAHISERVDKLTQNTDKRLHEISGQVERRLADGFEKTTATFADVLKRLALIDEAQKKITELSSNVVSLQHVLSDKQARGAFGEVQLSGLIRNVLPEANFHLQHTLSNHKRVDCLLMLPEPTGNVAIDAKFPLESYRALANCSDETQRRQAEQQFKQDLRYHIQAIAEKYIIPGETADGAMMFIPAEAIFAEIHAHHCDLVEMAQRARVWLVSPTTMMAILTTARAVLKDADTRKQVHIIQEHLLALSKDFDRFQHRMTNLSRHIHQAHADIEKVHTSATKITRRFQQIEQVDLEDQPHLLVEEE